MTRGSVYTHISAIALATRPQCETTSIATAAIQDDWKGIREVAEHLALKKYEDMVRKYHLVRFDVLFSLCVKKGCELRRIRFGLKLKFSFQKVVLHSD